MITTPKVAAVIVTYNRLEKLRLTIEQTLAQPFYRVIVVNNASTDGTADYLQTLTDARLQIVHETQNTGGAGGFAKGFKLAAWESEADWLVCYDDDAYPEPDALQHFIELAPEADVGGVAAAVYFPDGSICPMNRPGMDVFRSPLTIAKAFLGRASATGMTYDAYKRHELVDVCFSSFVGLFVRCKLVRDVIGLPRAELFVYRDDSLYTLAITRAGYKLLFAPTVRFAHACSTPSPGKKFSDPLWKAYYIIRNDIVFFKEFSRLYFPLVLPLILAKNFFRFSVHKDKKHFLEIFVLALSDGLTGHFSRKLKIDAPK